METQQKVNAERPTSDSSAWLAGAPEVLPGHRRNYLVTVQGQNGRLYVRTAYYAQNFWLPWYDSYASDNDESEGKHWTGWMDDIVDTCGDDLTVPLEGTVIGYMALPAPTND